MKTQIISSFFAFVFLFGCGFHCVDEVKEERQSPSAKFLAAVVERNCGATTSPSTMVTLRKIGTSSNPDKDTRILVLKGRDFIHVRWESDTELHVSKSSLKSFKKDTSWNDIKINFDQLVTTALCPGA